MEFSEIFRFLKGYVILELSGYNKEVNLEKIRKTGVTPMEVRYRDDVILLKLSASDFFLLKDSALFLGFDVVKYVGGCFALRSIKRRWCLMLGMLLIFITVFIGSRFIWTVEYTGVSEEKLAMLQDAVKIAGIKVGARKSTLPTPMEQKNIILANTDGIAWCWVYIKGTRAVVDVRENIIPPVIFDDDAACDVVAAKDAVIRKIITKNGTCVVKDGSAVSRGDVLIESRVECGDDFYMAHASGICEADTFYEKTGVYKLYINHKIYTGKKRSLITVKLFGLSLPLYVNGNIDYEYYDTEKKVHEIFLGKDNYIGVGLEKVSVFEYNVIKEPISAEACAEFARNELEKEISKELMPGSIKKDSVISVDKIDEETISVKLNMEFIEQIGTEKIIEEVTFFEPKTD